MKQKTVKIEDSYNFKKTIVELVTQKALFEKIKVISLFSGCGGLDLGFEGNFNIHESCIKDDDFIKSKNGNTVILKDNPFEIVFCNDIMQEAKVAWEANFSNKLEYSTKSIRELKGYLLPKADLVIGGFPCQDFSLAGKRAGFSSERGRLYQEMARIIREVRPKAFVAENVYGLLSINGAIETIKKEFENGGYKVFHYPVEAQQYGVPQTRKRVFFIGIKESDLKRKIDEKEFLPKPSHFDKAVTLNQVFKNLPEPNESSDPDQKSYSKAKFYGLNCQGNKSVDINKPAPTIRAEHHGNIEFRRLENNGNGNDRRLTVREAAIIQTFPTSFSFIEKNGKKLLSQSASYKVIGNAVPPLLAYHFARKLGKLWHDIF
ncbi:DNA cytosine methyltransferase [Rickettsia bellii]|nr:DNA (cytosine-5-)-methyltransferase [Rickettsia bellii]ABV78869.1 Cytosine-C5 specific DNA methylase [Rickettsia bellii OSU 85-389]KJV89894.1 DNA (cytosine-5-)-methyltransferase family protein [Rickettsia bellii str. RML An4]